MTRSTLILAAALVLLVIAGVLIGPAACTTAAGRSRPSPRKCPLGGRQIVCGRIGSVS
jgi:hypothetical protein